jgi:hypothetical protein
MPDPHFLYVVMAVVVTGLIGWVVAVNVWAPKRTQAPLSNAPAPTSHGGGAA